MAALASETPRVRVAALIIVDERIVLVRHRIGSTRYHLLPGGGVDYRETLSDALEREVREETGLLVKTGRPLLLSDTVDPNGPRHLVNVVFAAQVIGGAITDAPQDGRIEAVELVQPELLGELDLRPPIAEQIVRFLQEGDAFVAAYLGSLFSAERRE